MRADTCRSCIGGTILTWPTLRNPCMTLHLSLVDPGFDSLLVFFDVENRRKEKRNSKIVHCYNITLGSLHVYITLLWTRLSSHNRVQDLSPNLWADLWVRTGANNIEKSILLVRRKIGTVSRMSVYLLSLLTHTSAQTPANSGATRLAACHHRPYCVLRWRDG